MRRELATLLTSAVLLPGCSADTLPAEIHGTMATPGATATNERTAPQPLSVIGEFQQGIDAYVARYGCPVDVSLRLGKVGVAAEQSTDNTYNGQAMSLAVASIGSITVNESYPVIYDSLPAAAKPDLQHAGAHEAAHACLDPADIRSVDMRLFDGQVRIRTISGLSLITDRPADTPGTFLPYASIEEAAAEALAQSVEPGETHASYTAMAAELQRRMAARNMSHDQLAAYLQNSQFNAFLAHLTGIDNPSATTIDSTLRLFLDIQQNTS